MMEDTASVCGCQGPGGSNMGSISKSTAIKHAQVQYKWHRRSYAWNNKTVGRPGKTMERRANFKETLGRTLFLSGSRRSAVAATRTSCHLFILTVLLQFLLTYSQGPGPSVAPVDEQVSFQVYEEKPAGELVGVLPTRTGLQYRFSEDREEFSLNPVSGEIHTRIVLDRESLSRDTFDLFVQSTPSARHLIEVQITVLDINDNRPVFGQPTIEISFSEKDQPSTQAILDTATDPDLGVNSVTNSYQIISGNEEGKFRLVLLTDTSKPLLYLENTMELDREERNFYQLNISVSDGGSPSKFGYLTVNITVRDFNDNHPVFDQSYYSVLMNETAPVGTSVIKVHATDQDIGPNGDITYRVVNDDFDQFGVEPKTGVLTTLKTLHCYRACDASIVNCKPSSCFVTIEARDNGRPFPLVGRAYVTVNLVDENDHNPIVQFQYVSSELPYATVDEGSKVNAVVALVSVTDQDDGLNGQSTVRITKGNALGHFRLDLTSPMLHLIRVNGVLDRERVSKYNLTIEARDLGNPSRSSSAFLIIVVNDINDHTPVFQQVAYHAELSELVPIGSYVASITALDNDTGLNAQITYQILSGNAQGWFKIDSNTGLVTTQEALDREQESQLTLKIQAKDGASTPFFSNASLTISIWDENDEVPTFTHETYNVTLAEGAGTGTEVVTIYARDNDQGPNGTVYYAFSPAIEAQYPGLFQLNQVSGKITLSRELDREEYSELVVTVDASDQGVPPKSSTTTIHIHVTDVNDNLPIFYPLSYYATVLENQPAYTSVIQISATDEDTDENGTLLYTITSGSDQKFSINIKTGLISTQSQLDREQKALYRLTVVARDGGNLQSDRPATVEIVVADVQDTPPVFSENDGYNFTLVEDSGRTSPTLGRAVGQVEATTEDLQGELSYAISGGDNKAVFTIDSSTGHITTAKPIDRESKASYRLQITALGGQAFGETEVNVQITDVNDNVPRFSSQVIEAFVVENWPVGHSIYVAQADDPDDGANGDLEYSLSPDSSDVFSIDENTGMVQVARALQHVQERIFEVTVIAKDGGVPYLSSSQLVKITVRDVNDHTPTFDMSTYEVSIMESEPVNDRFFRVIARDEDLGLNGEVSYHIVNGNEDGSFGIFPDGVLYISRSLDRETKDMYILTISGVDKGVEARRSSTNVTIHLMDANDNPPTFSNETYIFHLLEGAVVGSEVGTVQATDLDMGRNAEVTYKIDGEPQGFTIHPKTGMLTSTLVFDREKQLADTGLDHVIIKVMATDSGEQPQMSKMSIRVYISDANDHVPEFTRSLYEASLFENEAIETQVVRVSATDMDYGENAIISYDIMNGNTGNRFAIDGSTGQITVKGPLDRELVNQYILTIMASDEGIPPMNSTTNVKITIEDINDNSPEFILDQTRVGVPETAQPGDHIAQVKAIDHDFGNNALLGYKIIDGNPRTTFLMDANTGSITLAGSLDYEQQSQYSLNISVTDSGDPTLSSFAIFTVDVLDSNDNAPQFSPDAVVKHIAEGVPTDTSVALVEATDPDYGINGLVVYSIVRQEPPSQQFDIDPDTGLVTTKMEIDRETADSYKLTILATDRSEPASTRRSSEKIVTIIVDDVNDNAPEFISMNAVPIMLGAQPDTLITKVKAVDLDAGENGQVAYSLFNGDTGLFRMDSLTGNLFLKSQLNSQILTYDLNIRAEDRARERPKSTLFQLTIFARSSIENGPSFSLTSYSGQVSENEPASTSVVTVSAGYSSRPTAEVEYFLSGLTSRGEDLPRYFQINPTTGVIVTTQPLDREKGYDVFDIQVYAVDRSSSTPKTRSTMVQITLLDQNDSPPKFAAGVYRFQVSEDVEKGHLVTTFTAEDADMQGSITYSIQDEEQSRGGSGKFSIDSNTGRLEVAGALDRETTASYRLSVVADDGVQNSTTTAVIEVTDVNDQKPDFTHGAYFFNVREDTPTGSRIGQISASDGDQGKNAELLYSVLTHWGRDKFSLHRNTGIFTLVGPLDYEEVHHYKLTVRAQDHGAASLSGSVAVYMNVIDVNDNAPIFDPSTYSIEVPEDADIDSSVLRVSATDMDSGDNGRMVYSIVGGNVDGHFTIEGATGIIRVAANLDREEYPHYRLEIRALDQARDTLDQLPGIAVVNVILLDVNDNAPEFETPSRITIMENTRVGASVLKVKATDKDVARNSYVQYGLLDNSNGMFSIGAVDGALQVHRALDREAVSQYELTVVAEDKGIPAQTTTLVMTVTVGDDNDHSPVFMRHSFSVEASEKAKMGLSLFQVSAEDLDDGLNAEIRYSIASGDDNHDFYIDAIVGEVTVQKRLDYERKNAYSLKVVARDLGDPAGSDTATATIVVTDTNDCIPAFVDAPYVAYVQENMAAASLPVLVLQVSAKDDDSPPFARVTYGLKKGDRSIFQINSTSGEIWAKQTLDREAKDKYEFLVTAVDSGSPRLTGTGAVTVLVGDDNDNEPAFRHSRYVAKIPENQAPFTKIAQVEATDPDQGKNADIRYRLLDGDSDKFSMNPATGEIVTRVVLDREEREVYRLVAIATDGGSIPRSSSVSLTLTVEDVNDNRPEFTRRTYTVYIRKPATADMFVIGVTALDPDSGPGGQLSYSLFGSADTANFNMDAERGIVTTKRYLTRATAGFSFRVRATDKGQNPLSDEAFVEVKFFPSSAVEFPTFTPTQRSFHISEDERTGFYVTTVLATSNRQGASLSYAIVGGNTGDAFQVAAGSGAVSVKTELDYEMVRNYNLWVAVEDRSATPPLTDHVALNLDVLDVNDNWPIFEQLYYNTSIMENNAMHELVVSVVAHDADDTGDNDITYRLMGTDGAFEIDTDMGTIRAVSQLDREAEDVYKLIVTASDHGSPPKVATATVDVHVRDKNDNAPRFTEIFSAHVAENSQVGSFVIKITSTDSDVGPNAVLTYSLTSNPGNKFAIDGNSGNITVAGALDRETHYRYVLKVASIDGAHKSETTVAIDVFDVNDNAPQFNRAAYEFDLVEGQVQVTAIGQVSAADRDAPGPNSDVFFRLRGSSEFFRVDPQTGQVYSRQPFKYQDPKAHPSVRNVRKVTVIAIDNGEPALSSEVVVTVRIMPANRHAPAFSKGAFVAPVSEDTVIGKSILQLNASDADNSGPNAAVQFSEVGGNGTDMINLDQGTGVLTLSRSVQGQAGVHYEVTIQAQDSGVPPRASIVQVTVVVVEINYYAPQFSGDNSNFEVTISEERAVGSVIATVPTASDSDQGPNGLVSYFLTGGDPESLFSVDESGGYLRVEKPLDYESRRIHYLNLTARDRGMIPRQTTRLYQVFVTDENDNPPVFNDTVYKAEVKENSPSGTAVFSIQATDADTPANAVTEYTLTGEGLALEKFSIQKNNGILRSQGSIDYETNQDFKVLVTAVNPGTSLSATATVSVRVTGVNEFVPQFSQMEYQFIVSESASPGFSIGSVHATDEDAGDEGVVYYYLVGDSNMKGFEMDRRTGVLSIFNAIDREATSEISLDVLAKNAGPIAGNDTASCKVRVIVRDANDPPQFTQALYEASVQEDAQTSTSVIKVSAVDNDLQSQDRRFSYVLLDGNDGGAFLMDSQSGLIYTVAELDREAVPVYELTVGAVDTGTPPATGTAIVKVTLGDFNDNGPHFEPVTPRGVITENRPPYSDVVINLLTFTRDLDVAPNRGPYQYELLSHRDLFDVSRTIGSVKAKVELDREQTDEYEISVKVIDNGSPTMSSTLTFKVDVEDINDQPSVMRPLNVLVYAYQGRYTGGRIADVKPLDPDIKGDYQCEIVGGDTTLFSIPKSCDLHVVQLQDMATYRLNISGSDGVHSVVKYEVNVEFRRLDEGAVDHSIFLSLDGIDSATFLKDSYDRLISALNSIFPGNDGVVMFSLAKDSSREDVLNVLLAVRGTGDSYMSKVAVSQAIQANRKQLESSAGVKIVSVNTNPCQSDPCNSAGECSYEVLTGEQSAVADSPAFVFTSLDVTQEVQCTCRAGFTGKRCESAINHCDQNPCKNSAICQSIEASSGMSYKCVCPSGWKGDLCDVDVDECTPSSSSPCLNGGACHNLNGGYTCDCPTKFSGDNCELSLDACASSPCQNGGICTSLPSNTFACECKFGNRGNRCEITSRGFEALSFAEYEVDLGQQENSIVIEFATVKENALLFYSPASDTDFLALEILDGNVRFSFALDKSDEPTRITVPKLVTGGQWYRVQASRKGKVGTLKVSECPVGDATCAQCVDGDANCFRRASQGSFTVLNIDSHRVSVGGVSDISLILAHPNQVETHDFVGCLRDVHVDSVALFQSRPLSTKHVSDSCLRSAAGTSCSTDACANDATCVDDWDQKRCQCPKGFVGGTCDQAVESFSFSPNTVVTYQQRENYRRDLLLQQSTLGNRRKRSVAADGHVISVTFRTTEQEGLLYCATGGSLSTAFYVSGGKLQYRSGSANSEEKLMTLDKVVSDGVWHEASLQIQGDTVTLTAGDAKNTKSFDTAVHDALGVTLEAMGLGGQPKGYTIDLAVPTEGFKGCLKDFEIDQESVPLEGSTERFSISQEGGVEYACSMAAVGPPVHVAVIVVVVFFSVALIVILIVFVLLRMRRRKRAKEGEQQPHGKQNGSTVKANGPPPAEENTVHDNRSHQDSGFTENGDLTEEAIIQQHVAKELGLSYSREEDDFGNTLPSTRPDVVGSDLTGPIGLRQGDIVLENHSGMFNEGYQDEPPEHYDIDAASSIAPSDVVDVSHHYKRFRKGVFDKNNRKNGIPGGGFYQPQYHQHHQPHPHHPYPPRKSRDSLTSASRQSPVSLLSSHRSSPASPSILGIPNTRLALSPVNNLNRHSDGSTGAYPHSPSPNIPSRDRRRSPVQAPVSLRSTPLSGVSALYSPGGGDDSSTSAYSERQPMPNGHPGSRPHSALANGRPGSRTRQPISQIGPRGTPTVGLTVDEINEMNTHHKPSPTSLLDAVSSTSSSSDVPMQNVINRTDFTHADLLDPGAVLPPESSSDESINDSFTCSEFEYDNDRMRNAFSNPHRLRPPQRLARVDESGDSDSRHRNHQNLNNHQGSDSNKDDSFSTFFTSEDEMSITPGNGSKLPPNALNLDYLLNWGPNFEKLVGVFSDIAQLPDAESSYERPPSASRSSSRGSPQPKSPLPKAPTPSSLSMPVILEDSGFSGRENGVHEVHENGLENSFDSLKEEYV